MGSTTHLDGKLAQRLTNALLSTFPRRYALEKLLLFELNVDLAAITRARDHEECVFYVVKWAMQQERVRELVTAAHAAAPDDATLKAVARELRTSAQNGADSTESPDAGGRSLGRKRAKTAAGIDDSPAPTKRRKPSPRPPSRRATPTAEDKPPRPRERGSWRLWKNGSILKIAFLDGSPLLRERVLKVAREWTQHANLRFEPTASLADSDLRVSFTQAEGSWSYHGTDALSAPKSQRTMNFGWLEDNTPDEEVRRVVLHEFGHVLGFINEYQNPNADIEWDWDQVYALFQGPPNNWPREAIDANMSPVSADDLPGYREFDPTSIMMFSFPAVLNRNGVAYKQGSELSASDREFAEKLYPRDGTAFSDAEPRQGPPELAPARSSGSGVRDRPRPLDRPARRTRPAPGVEHLNLLFFAAQPSDTPPLALSDEYGLILESLRKHAGTRVHVVYLPKVGFGDLSQNLLHYEPMVVHFSGHGDAAGQLMFVDQQRRASPAPMAAVGNVFRILKDKIRCVILNACYSRAQAEAICDHIDCVIGMSRAIADADAIRFTAEFYMALGYGRSVKLAFELGCTAVNMQGAQQQVAARDFGRPGSSAPSRDPQPVLLHREGVDPDALVLISPEA